MSEKYAVSQKFMTELEEWKDTLESNDDEYEHFVGIDKLTILPDVVFDWRYIGNLKERNNRLIAILRWVNGGDVFEVEKPKKWIVRSKETDGVNRNFYVNVSPDKTWFGTTVEKGLATQFDTKEEADKYVNSLTESVPYK